MKDLKDVKVQVRITASEKQMIDDLKKQGKFSISEFFRKSLKDHYESNLAHSPLNN